MRIFLVLVLALLAAGACKKASEKDQVKLVEEDARAPSDFEGKFLENIPYRFRLTQPGPDWKLLDRDDARQITTDAQAALSLDVGLTAVVIVEHAPGMQLGQMSDLILDAMPIEQKSIVKREEEQYLGLNSVRYQVTGNVSEVPMRYEGRIFMRGPYAYQMIAFAASGLVEDKDWARALGSFALSEGEIAPEQDDSSSPDMVGVGWQLKDGVFESAVSGLRVAPESGWKALVGAEARRMNADAEVVLVRQAPDAYFLVIPERIGGSSQESYLQNRIDATAANLKGDVKRTKIKSVLLGQEIESTILSGGELPWTFQVSVAFRDGWALQATGWYTAGVGEAGKKAIAEAMKSVSMMPADSTAALRSELLALPDEQDAVGTAFSLRSGVFRDYQHGVVWTKPKGFWELSVGQEVREINPNAQLYGRYLNSVLHFMLVADIGESPLDAARYHEAAFAGVQQSLSLKLISGPKSIKIGSGVALQSDATTETAGIDLAYRVVTAVHGAQGVQLYIWGEAEGVKRSMGAMKEAIQSLVLRSPLPAHEMRKGEYVDHRLGFSMRLDRKHRYHDTTPPELAGIGSYPTWGVDGADWVGVLAIRAIEAGRDREWSMNLMEERIRDSLTKLIKGAKSVKEDTTLLGMPARHLTWKSETTRLDAYLIRRHQTIYAIAATDADGGKEMIEKALKGFRLID